MAVQSCSFLFDQVTTTNKSDSPESEISDLFSAMCRGTGEVELFSKSELDELHVEGGMETGAGEVDGGMGTDTVGETDEVGVGRGTGADEVDGRTGPDTGGGTETGADGGTEAGADEVDGRTGPDTGGGTETGADGISTCSIFPAGFPSESTKNSSNTCIFTSAQECTHVHVQIVMQNRYL